MKKIFLTTMSVICCLVLYSQTRECGKRLDSAQVVKIAKKYHAYLLNDGYIQPQIKFDEDRCEWEVRSYKSRHTNKGRCKYTNGCTLITTITVTIDDKTQKLKSRKKTEKLYPNYE